MLPIFKKPVKAPVSKLMYSPVFAEEILGVMYKKGEFLPHARIRILTSTPAALVGLAFDGEETKFFVASHPNVIAHIEHQGCVPLAQTQHLRFFKDKKRMNAYFSKLAI
jgi:hypothetical protein